MKGRCLCVLLLLISLPGLGQEAFTTRNSNLRSGPYTKSKVLRTVPGGTPVRVISKYPRLGYVRVHDSSADDTGWLLQRNLVVSTSEEATETSTQLQRLNARVGDPQIYPNAQTTPGKADPTVTQTNIAKNICNEGWATDSIRPSSSVTNKIKIQTMASYGFTDAANHYELDHLLSLQNGGCPDCVENLWPQAYGDKAHPMTQNERYAWNRLHPDGGRFSRARWKRMS